MFGPEEAVGAQDNAVGAVGRIMTALPHVLPLQQVLPVFLRALPLKVRTVLARVFACCLLEVLLVYHLYL